MHGRTLDRILQYLEMCVEKLDDPNYRLEVDIPLPSIVGGIFPEETRKLREELERACSKVKGGSETLKDSYKACLKKVLKHTRRGMPQSSEVEKALEETVRCNLSLPLADASGALLEALIKAASIFSRRSFEAAWLTAEALGKNLQPNSEITPGDLKLHDRDRRCIHPVWSFLADKGRRLIVELRSLNYEMSTVIDALSSAGESLKDEVKDLHDLVAEAEKKREKKALVEAISKKLREDFKKCLKYMLANYIADHLLALHSVMRKFGEDLRNNDLEYYLNVVFKDCCFLEYEVYAALLERCVPAIPRVQLTYFPVPREERGARAEREVTDLDVVAAPGEELWLIEVTRSTGEDKLREDMEKLEQLIGELGASRALVICTREAQKVAEKLLQTRRSQVSFTAFEELDSKLRKLLLSGARCCP
jgi:hypothetical protein